MPSTRMAVDALARRLGFDPPRVAAVARRLTDAHVIPSGAPKTPPHLEPEHVVAIVIGCAIDAPLRAIPDAVRDYLAMTPGGADVSQAPAAIDRTVSDALEIWADIALYGDAATLRNDRIEVVSNWPEVAIHIDGKARRFVTPGTVATHWQSAWHRRSTTINGAALVDCLRELFSKENQ